MIHIIEMKETPDWHCLKTQLNVLYEYMPHKNVFITLTMTEILMCTKETQKQNEQIY